MNLIFSSFHFNPVANKSHAVKIETYLHNIYVALCSAKDNNPEDDVALIITPDTNPVIPDDFKNQLSKKNILIKEMPFDSFLGDNNQIWSFSFYRLSIIKALCEDDTYENFCSIDSDTVTVRSYKDMWYDCKDFILLYDINHSHEIEQAKDTFLDYKDLTNKEVYLTNYGGEFIAGSKKIFKEYMKVCLDVFNRLMEKGIQYKHGDETVLGIASYEAFDKGIRVKNASPYVFRFWTSEHFKLICTVYKYNPVCVYHLPDEKTHGLEKIYKYYVRKNNLPSNEKISKWSGIKCKSAFRPRVFIGRLIGFLRR